MAAYGEIPMAAVSFCACVRSWHRRICHRLRGTVLGAHGGTCLPGLSTGLSNSSWRRRRGGATLSPRSRAIISQPVRRLRGFERVTLDPGQTRTVTFTLNKSDFGFYDNRGRFVVEPGEIDVYAGNSSAADTKQSFTVGR
jgi:hypothetical protein